MEEVSTKPTGYKEYVAGLLAGVATVIVGHPFDTVKVKLQKHNTEVEGIKYRNGLHCTVRILATEGVRGLYKGATSSFIGVAFESSLVFGIYSHTKKLLQGGVQSSGPQPQVIIPSAAFGGAIISFVLCPSELVKAELLQCRMQVQGADSVPKLGSYSSPLDCAVKTIKSDGVTGMFRGGSTTLLRESVGNAVFFSVYEYVRYYMYLRLNMDSSDPHNLTDIGIGILTGGLGGVAVSILTSLRFEFFNSSYCLYLLIFAPHFWSAVLPLDVAKTVIQTAPDKSCQRNPFQVLNSVTRSDSLIIIYRRAGVRGCYAGLGPTIVRAFPANAAAIVTWELAMKLLGIKNE
ncbi:mitochondrial arginine transporter BAC1-like [Gossypium australe]|uniref:Mitochondrial arginine transporter BAC1-like n=1 Tax=Gossypium australe TaxID=47621 RepID=A0A5B6W9U0_9ROSI|nr:mitochondrial arginine transporter BAC1-like [Gossypium australe]